MMALEYKKILRSTKSGGFEETGKVNLIIHGDLTKQYLQEIRTGNYDELWLRWGNFERMESIVDEEISLKRIHLVGDGRKVQDVTWIGQCRELEYLSLDTNQKGYIDFSNLVKLVEISELTWGKASENMIQSAIGLVTLNISGFKGSLSDFSDCVAKSINTLGLSRGNLKTLEGIEKFKLISNFTLNQLLHLLSIAEIKSCRKISSLRISGCNKLKSLDVLRELTELKVLDFGNKELASLSLLPKEKLEKISLSDSTVLLDNDVEMFLDFPHLKRAIFSKRQPYKYGATEIRDMLSARLN